MTHHSRVPAALSRTGLAASVLTAGLLVVGLADLSAAVFEPGTPAKDVSRGADNDNAANTFIQPPGVTAPQHMDDADVLFGRDNDDLLIGRLGSDTLLGGPDDDILVGGPDQYVGLGADVLVGDTGDDIAVWSPGDGNDAFAGNEDRDTTIVAPLVLRGGVPLLTREHGRRVPHVAIGGQTAWTCAIQEVPASQRLGGQFLVRVYDNGVLTSTLREKDVETVYCPSPRAGHARVAHLTGPHPTRLHTVALRRVRGTVGDIVAPVG